MAQRLGERSRLSVAPHHEEREHARVASSWRRPIRGSEVECQSRVALGATQVAGEQERLQRPDAAPPASGLGVGEAPPVAGRRAVEPDARLLLPALHREGEGCAPGSAADPSQLLIAASPVVGTDGVEQSRAPVAVAAHLASEMPAPLVGSEVGRGVGIEVGEVLARHEVARRRRGQSSREHERTHVLGRHGPAKADAGQRHEVATGHPDRLRPLMEFFDVVARRRMHRVFSDESLTREDLDQLVRAGARAPQAGNAPVRRFVVVDDPGIVRTLRQVMPSFISNAPAAIVVCTDLDLVSRLMGERGRDTVSRIDAGTAAENIALAATALGLGACFSQSSTEPAVRAVLDLPEHVRPEIVVAVGRVPERPSQAVRMLRPPVDHNRFDSPWEASP
jgi:nitroreductase